MQILIENLTLTRFMERKKIVMTVKMYLSLPPCFKKKTGTCQSHGQIFYADQLGYTS